MARTKIEGRSGGQVRIYFGRRGPWGRPLASDLELILADKAGVRSDILHRVNHAKSRGGIYIRIVIKDKNKG